MGNGIYILGMGLSGIYAKMANKSAISIDKSRFIDIPTRYIYILNGYENDYARKERRVDILDDIKNVDFKNREIKGLNKTYTYDKLIIALGHSQAYENIDGYENMIKLETSKDADLLKNRLENSNNVVIIGGGYLGVELAGIIKGKKINLINSGKHLLNGININASNYIKNKLENMGVNIIMNERVMHVTTDRVITNNSEILADTVIYAGGITGNKIIKTFDIKQENSRIIVNNKLRSVEYDDVYACGDSMKIMNLNVPLTAFMARKSGEISMKNAMGNDLEFKYTSSGNIINIGGELLLIKSNKFQKNGVIKIIKNYVNKKTDKTIKKLNNN